MSAASARTGRVVQAMPVVGAQPARSGMHLVEWGCELAGTAMLLLCGLSAVCFDFGSRSPLRHHATAPRLLLTGLLFAGTGSLIAISPLGRRSGAHLNPAVTVAFWTQHKVHLHDLGGYIAAQFAGAVIGATAVRLLWRGQAVSVHVGATLPGHGLTDWQAAAIEAGMTALLILTILVMTSRSRLTRWTPLVLWPLIATLVWQVAPYTGTSLNPARSFGPALLASVLGSYWVYVAGPLLGVGIAVAVFALMRDYTVLTTKLFHDPTYPSTMASSLPVARAAPPVSSAQSAPPR
jgi:aquaporin Z